MACPVYTNKIVFNEFNELVELLGGRPMTLEEFLDSALRNLRTGLDYSAMEAAYTIYDKNNGNTLDKTPDGKPSLLFQSLLELVNGDRIKAARLKAIVYSNSFITKFGDWTNKNSLNDVSKVVDENGEPKLVFHGTNSDYSKGFRSAKREKGSGAPETKKRNDFYFNVQPFTSLLYIDGVNRNGRDVNGFGTWNKLWWELKEIMSNGRRENNDWKDIVISEETIRQAIPNKKGIFNRDSGGTNGKWLSERKADYGYENKTDKEFFEEVFGIRFGEDTFNTWVERNRKIFEDIYSADPQTKGLYGAFVVIKNPIIEHNQNTYYEELRNLMTIAEQNGNDGIISYNSDNEFNSDVVIPLNIGETDEEREQRIIFLNLSNTQKSNTVLNNSKPFTQFNVASTQLLFGNDLSTKLQNNETVSSKELLNSLLTRDVLFPTSSRLCKMLAIHDVPVRLAQLEDYVIATTITDQNGGSVILLNSNVLSTVSNEFAATKLLHEMIHAITVLALTNPVTNEEKKFANSTKKLYKKLDLLFPSYRFNRNDPFEVYHILTNENEFAAIFMSDDIMRGELFKIVKDNNTSSNKLYLALKNFINSLSNFLINRKIFNTTEELLQNYKQSFEDFILGRPAIKNGNITDSRLLDLLYNFQNLNLIENERFINITDSYLFQNNNFKRNNATINIDEKDTRSYVESVNRPYTIEEAKLKLDALCKNVALNLRKRLVAIKTTTISTEDKTKILLILNNQIDQFESDTISRWVALLNFISLVEPQLITDETIIRKIRNYNKVVSDNVYFYQRHDNFGTYFNILKEINNTLSIDTILNVLLDEMQTDPNVSDATKEDVLRLLNSVEAAQNLALAGLEHTKAILINNLKNKFEKHAREVGDLDLLEYIENLEIIGYDTSGFLRRLGSADAAKDKGLNFLASLINKSIHDAQRDSQKIATRLIKLRDDLKFNEKLTDIYEKNTSGLFTGYIVRKRNYGQFFTDYNNFMQLLNKEFGIIDLDNRIPPVDQEQASEWNKKRNAWLNERCERPYTEKYYQLYDQLSSFTKSRKNAIQSEINAIKLLCLRDDGFYHYEDLTSEQWERLNNFYGLKRQLSNLYDLNGDLKTGLDLLIALELKSFNEQVFKQSKVEKAWKEWSEARAEIIKLCGGKKEYDKGEDGNFDFKKLKLWDDRNSRYVLRQDEETGETLLFKHILNEIDRKPVYELNGDGGETYRQNQEKINALKNQFRRVNSGEIDPKRMGLKLQNEILRLEKENEKIKKAAKKNRNVKKDANAYGKVFKKYAKFEWTETYRKMYQYALKLDLANNWEPGDEDDYGPMLTAFRKKTGKIIGHFSGDDVIYEFRPHSWYTKIVAQPEYRNEFMELLPGDGWIDMEINQEYVNENYEKIKSEEGSEGNTMIPKINYVDENGKRRYDNTKQYDKIIKSKSLSNLYYGIIDIMKEANEMLTNRKYNDNYLLPQIKGSLHDRMQKHNFSGASKAFFTYVKEKFGWISEDDVEFGQTLFDDLQHDSGSDGIIINNGNQLYKNTTKGLRPDGSPLRMVILPYTKRLKDPSQLSSDLLNIVYEYYFASAKFKNKSKIKDTCESVVDMMMDRKYQTAANIKKEAKEIQRRHQEELYGKKTNSSSEEVAPSGEQSNTYQMGRKFLDMNLYDIRIDKSTTKIGNFALMKLYREFINAVSAINLGNNPAVAFTGFTTSLLNHITQSLTGYNYDTKTSLKASSTVLGQMLKSFGGATMIANPFSRNRLVIISEEFNIAGQGEKKLKHSNRNRLLNAINENKTYGMMSGLDFVAKSNIMLSVIMSYHFVDGEFLTKSDIYARAWNKDKQWLKTQLQKWDKGLDLYDAIDTKTGIFKIKDLYQLAYDDIVDRLHNKIEKFSEAADGMATYTQKAAISTSYLGMALLIHRQYLPLMLLERFGNTVWDEDTQQYHGGQYRIAYNFFKYMLFGEDGYSWSGFKDALKPFSGNIRQRYKNYFGLDENYNVKFYDDKHNDLYNMKLFNMDRFKRKAMRQLFIENILYHALLRPITLYAIGLSKQEDKKDEKLLLLLVYIMTRTLYEYYTPYRIDDVMSNLKSPSAALGLTDRIQQIIEGIGLGGTSSVIGIIHAILDTFEKSDSDNIVSDYFNKEISRGIYSTNKTPEILGFKPNTKFKRDLFKLTPIHNLYELVYGAYDKNNYYVNQIIKIPKEEYEDYYDVIENIDLNEFDSEE